MELLTKTAPRTGQDQQLQFQITDTQTSAILTTRTEAEQHGGSQFDPKLPFMTTVANSRDGEGFPDVGQW